MREYYPLLIVGAILGVLSTIFIIAYATMKDKKEAIGFDRNMKDSEIVRRLLKYAKPHWPTFLLVLVLMAFSIVYDIVSPLVIGELTDSIKEGFELSELDLKLRGAGDIHGTQQSGEAFELNIANLATDTQIMQLTRDEALAILAADPALEHPANVGLRRLRDKHHKRERIDFSDIS